MSRERNDAGQYADGIDPDTVIDVFDARDDLARPVTAGDVVDELGIARRTAHNKLNALVERGELETRKIGARARVWWRPIPAEENDGFDTGGLQGDATTTLADTDAEHGATTADATDATESPAEDRNAESADTRAETDALADDVRAYLDRRNDPPKTAHGQAALVEAVALLRDHGTMKTADLRDALAEEYGDHYATPKAMWESVQRYLEDTPGAAKGEYGEWTYAGDDAVREQLDSAEAGVYDPTTEFKE